MIIVYLIILVFVDALLHMIAVHQSQGLTPFPFGVTKACWIGRVLLTVINVRFLGWVAGIVLSTCEFFGLLYASIGWMFYLPVVLKPLKPLETPEIKEYKIARAEPAILSCSIIGLIIFCICSFIFVPHKALLTVMIDNLYLICIALIVLVAGFLARIVIAKSLK